MVPRVLVPSELSPVGDTVQILRPRHPEHRRLHRWLARHVFTRSRYLRFPLDRRGSRIWCLIDNRRTVDELVGEYLRYYPDDHRQVELRICRFLESLADHGFIEIVARSDAAGRLPGESD
jgi:hypothetical protein